MILTSIQFFFIDFRWCEGSGASFHCLRMRSRSTRKCAHMNAGDLGSILVVCAGQKHRAELRMRPTTTQLGVFLWIRMFFTACKTSARWLIERGHVNKVMTYRMLMSHVTLKHNTPIAFLVLWLVTTWSSPVYYSVRKGTILLHRWRHFITWFTQESYTDDVAIR